MLPQVRRWRWNLRLFVQVDKRCCNETQRLFRQVPSGEGAGRVYVRLVADSISSELPGRLEGHVGRPSHAQQLASASANEPQR